MCSIINTEKKVREILKENIKTSVSFDEIGTEHSLSEIGVNSIDFIKVIVAIETEFDFEFNDEDLDFSMYDNIQKIVSYIENKLNN